VIPVTTIALKEVIVTSIQSPTKIVTIRVIQTDAMSESAQTRKSFGGLLSAFVAFSTLDNWPPIFGDIIVLSEKT